MEESNKKFYLYMTIGISIGNILSNINAKTAGTVIFCGMALCLVLFNLRQYERSRSLFDLAEVVGWFTMALGSVAIRFFERNVGIAFSVAGLVLIVAGIFLQWRAARKKQRQE